MPRPEPNFISFEIDGREVRAPEGSMLVDAAKLGDVEIMAQVQSNIIGNCLCVLGDSMAMPIGSMLEKFRDEFELHIEEARARNDASDLELGAGELASVATAGPS